MQHRRRALSRDLRYGERRNSVRFTRAVSSVLRETGALSRRRTDDAHTSVSNGPGLRSCGGATAAQPEAHTAAAVIAKDEAWGAAESRGDAPFVDHLLLPGYRSIGSDGTTTTRETITSHTSLRKGDPFYAAKVAEWRKSHPSKAEVLIAGDTAVLTWVAQDTTDTRVRSSDIFTYVGGEWRAVYSQHSAL